jgi:hypothetical protein
MIQKNYTNLIINSSILFVITSTLEMTLHELGHFIAGHLVHGKGIILFHNYVSGDSENMPLNQVLFVKAAGPLVSLFIGIIFQLICVKISTRNLTFLFCLYMSVFGYIGFFGYLMIAPVFTYGDTGYIFNALNFPMWIIICIALSGAVILYFIMRSLMKYFVALGTEEISNSKELRSPFVNSLIFYPLLIGILITTLLNLPVPTFASIIAPLCSPFAIMWAYGDALRKIYPHTIMSKDLLSINSKNLKWLIALILIVLMNRLLVMGFSIH